tara:strand:+ start:2663 stop:3259 length:597 start_codon:yes stop_codon:yes gene_type:complete
MTNTKDLLSRVETIIKNSNSDTLTEIKNISDILEVNGKVATVLHFVNKDSDWNPHTLTLLDDLLKEEKLTEGMSQEKMDFYLLNYLDKTWRETLVKRLREAKGFNYVSHWLSSTIADIIQDVEKLGLYPEIDFKSNAEKGTVEYEDFEPIFGDSGTFIYKPVSEWINNVVKSEETHGLKLDNYKSSKTFFDVTPHEDY